MDRWNLVPYRILLPVQLLILAVMAWIVSGVWLQYRPLSERQPAFGAILIWASCIYAGVMAIRYAIRMKRRPGERWFGGAIPIVFHMVLAAFLFTWGRYNTSG